MKKLLALTLIIFVNDCLSMIDNRSGTNAEYVYFNGTTPVTEPAMQNDIYQITSTYQFPMNTNPTNASAIAALSGSDREAMYMRELGFISDKIHEKYSDVHILPIPKSLYQLFVLRECLGRFSSINEEVIDAFRLEQHINLFDDLSFSANTVAEHASKGNPISEACAGYMLDQNVKTLFWDVNKRIFEFLKIFDISNPLYEKQLEFIADNLLEDLRGDRSLLEKFCHVNDKKEYLLDMKAHSLFYIKLLFADKQEFNRYKTSILSFLGEELRTMENESLRGTCRIYRGGRARISSTDKCHDVYYKSGKFGKEKDWDGEGMYEGVGKAALSFSNGWFGGVINDPDDGMAFGFFLKGEANKYKRLFLADVDKRKMGAVFIPQISILGAALGVNELHHPRMKMLAPCEEIPGIDGMAGIPEDSKSMHELVCDTEADFSQFKVTEVTDKGAANFVVNVKK